MIAPAPIHTSALHDGRPQVGPAGKQHRHTRPIDLVVSAHDHHARGQHDVGTQFNLRTEVGLEGNKGVFSSNQVGRNK